MDGGLRFTPSQIRSVVLGNLLTPLLWIILVVSPMCFLAAATIDTSIRWFFAVVGAFPIITALGIYVAAFIKNPESLLSEEFQNKKRALECLGDDRYNPENVVALIGAQRALPNPNRNDASSDSARGNDV